MTGTILTYMQDREADGIVFVGPAGAAKSAAAKATGGTAGIPTIAFDLSAMESSLVGASTERLRTALQIIDAVSQGRMLFIATVIPLQACHPNCVDASRWERSSLTCQQRMSGRRSGGSISRSTACLASNQTTKAGQVRKSKSVAGRRTGWESRSPRHHGTSCQFHDLRLSRSKPYVRWRPGNSSVPQSRAYTATKKKLLRLAGVSSGS
jgi:hypothetical protein